MAVPTFAQFSSGGFDLSKENLYYGVRFGGTSASLSGDISMGAKIGMTLAGIIGLHLSQSTPVFLESGLYYTQRGAKEGDVEITHNNLEIPIVVKYGIQVSDNVAILPFIGPYFAYAVSSDYKYKGKGVDPDEFRPNRNNMGFKLGCGAEYNKLYLELGQYDCRSDVCSYLELGYQFGVTNFIDDDNLTGHNNALFLNFGVNF